MSDMVTPVLIFVGVIAVTVVLFGGWVVVSLFRAIGGWLDRGTARPQPAMMPSHAAPSFGPVRPCHNAVCRVANPTHARFCRHCGQAMA